ncbi:hypothetical protein V8F20_001440 [Naviculisporaceae sp. PSN 640]
MPSIMKLPEEVALRLAKKLQDVPDLAALALTCRKYYEIANPVLYRRAVEQLELWAPKTPEDFDWSERPFNQSPLIWAARKNLVSTLQKTLAAGASATHIHVGCLPNLQVPLPPTPDSPGSPLGPDFYFNPSDPNIFPDMDPPDIWEVPLAFTAIHVAAKVGSKEVLNLLLNHRSYSKRGLKSEWVCCRPQRALTHAADDPWPSEHWYYNQGDISKAPWSPLHLAVCHRRKGIARILINHPTTTIRDIFCPDSGSHEGYFTPFHLAAATGQLDILEMMAQQLIKERGAENILGRDGDYAYSIDNRDNAGLTPLYHAIVKGHWNTTVPYLVNLGADINSMAKYTLNNGYRGGKDCDVQASVFAEFCRVGRFQGACKLLDQPRLILDRSTELHVTEHSHLGRSGFTRMSYTIPFLHLCCMDPIEEEESEEDDTWDPSLHKSPEARKLAEKAEEKKWRVVLIKKLVDRGLDPNYPWGFGDDPGSTPLIVAARHGNLSMINALIDAGANVRCKNRKGHNALMAAITQRGTFDMRFYDREHAESKEWWLITSTQARMSLSRLREVTERLLEAGTPINEQDHDGFTVLHLFFHGPPSQPFVPVFLTRSETVLSRNRPIRFSKEEKSFLQFLLCKGADPFIGCGIRHRSVLWTIFAGLWSEAATTILQTEHGPRIKTYLTENPDQLRAMFFAIVKAHVDQPQKKGGLLDVLEELLHLDTERHLTTDRWILQDVLSLGLAQKSHQWTRMIITSLIRRMDLKKMRLDSLTTAELFQSAVQVKAWNLASRLIDMLDFKSEPARTKSRSNDLTPTRLILECFYHGSPKRFLEEKIDEDRGKCIIRALDAGMSIHALRWDKNGEAPGLLSGTGAGEVDHTHTALSWAIFRKWAPMVELMLQKQPNVQADGIDASAYLLYFLSNMWEDYDAKYKSKSGKPSNLTLEMDVSICHRIMTALLAAGADPTLPHGCGKYPLEILVEKLEERTELVRKYKCWFSSLAKGIKKPDVPKNFAKRIRRLETAPFLPST